MKKSIVYLGLAVTLFCNAATAAVVTKSNNPVKTEYAKKATPLAVAIAKGDVEAVKKFIGYGTDINEKSNDMTPLMIAARYNQVAIINLLLDNGANAKATNSKGFNALKYAQLSNANDAAEVLIQAAAK